MSKSVLSTLYIVNPNDLIAIESLGKPGGYGKTQDEWYEPEQKRVAVKYVTLGQHMTDQFCEWHGLILSNHLWAMQNIHFLKFYGCVIMPRQQDKKEKEQSSKKTMLGYVQEKADMSLIDYFEDLDKQKQTPIQDAHAYSLLVQILMALWTLHKYGYAYHNDCYLRNVFVTLDASKLGSSVTYLERENKWFLTCPLFGTTIKLADFGFFTCSEIPGAYHTRHSSYLSWPPPNDLKDIKNLKHITYYDLPNPSQRDLISILWSFNYDTPSTLFTHSFRQFLQNWLHSCLSSNTNTEIFETQVESQLSTWTHIFQQYHRHDNTMIPIISLRALNATKWKKERKIASQTWFTHVFPYTPTIYRSPGNNTQRLMHRIPLHIWKQIPEEDLKSRLVEALYPFKSKYDNGQAICTYAWVDERYGSVNLCLQSSNQKRKRKTFIAMCVYIPSLLVSIRYITNPNPHHNFPIYSTKNNNPSWVVSVLRLIFSDKIFSTHF